MIVATKYGKISGIQQGDSTVFKGIRYAKPPVGELRFAPPQEPEKWDGVITADKWGNGCVESPHQPGGFYDKEFYSVPEFIPSRNEDCLFLNIWTPTKTGNEKLPVAFWIHGGAFMGGCGNELEFDGEEFGRQGIVLVTINYRCNVFGFFSSKELSAEQGGISGNYGILDQIAALRWVRENISGFGGDPDNITIFGQSAGAMSVQTLVSSPLTKGMIKRAIMQSAGGHKTGINRDRTQTAAEAEGADLIEALGGATLTDLRAMKADELLTKSLEIAFAGMKKGTGGLMFTPVLDGKVLIDTYDQTIEKGLTHDIDYIIGSTRSDLTVTPEILKKGEKSALYNGCISWSLEQQKLGRKADYVYYFTRDLPGDDAGAFHSSELWYVFNTLSRCWRPFTDADRDLCRRMVGYWSNFMKTGDPNGTGLPVWAPCADSDPNVIILDI